MLSVLPWPWYQGMKKVVLLDRRIQQISIKSIPLQINSYGHYPSYCCVSLYHLFGHFLASENAFCEETIRVFTQKIHNLFNYNCYCVVVNGGGKWHL